MGSNDIKKIFINTVAIGSLMGRIVSKIKIKLNSDTVNDTILVERFWIEFVIVQE